MRNNWASTGAHRFRQFQWNINILHVIRTCFLRQVFPSRIGQNAQGETILGLNELEGTLGQMPRWVVDQMPMPRNSAGIEDGLLWSSTKPRELIDDSAVDRRNASLLEAVEDVSDWFIHLGDTAYGDGARDHSDSIGWVALILCLPQGVQAEPALEVAVNDRHPRHRLVVLTVERNPPSSIRSTHRNLAGLWVCREELFYSRGSFF